MGEPGNIRNFILKDINQITKANLYPLWDPQDRKIEPAQYYRHAGYRIEGDYQFLDTEVFRSEKQRSIYTKRILLFCRLII
jgi:hypothetical protein